MRRRPRRQPRPRPRHGRDGGPARRGRRLVVAALTAYLGVLAVNRSIVEVAGPSMEPTLWAGDRLLTVPAWPGGIRGGRIVVVRDPADPAHPVIKRVHAVVGGRVEVRGDDPARSTDSRTWGPLDHEEVRRVVIARWPDLRTRLDRRS